MIGNNRAPRGEKGANGPYFCNITTLVGYRVAISGRDRSCHVRRRKSALRERRARFTARDKFAQWIRIACRPKVNDAVLAVIRRPCAFMSESARRRVTGAAPLRPPGT